MKINDKFIQIQGPFKAKNDIIQYIRNNYNPNFWYIKRIGIQTEIGHICNIDGNLFEIGKTGILEFNNVRIYSLYFLQNEPESTLIDCIIE